MLGRFCDQPSSATISFMTSTSGRPNGECRNDADLAIAAAAGDRAAFAAIYQRYSVRLQNYCVTVVRDHHLAADCVHDAFCAAAVELPKLRDPDRLAPWLYSIVRRNALRALRHRNREAACDEVADSPSSEPDPFAVASRNELANLLTQATDGLSERDRRVLELAYQQGLTGPELANALGIRHDSAKKMLQRVRATVARSIGALLVARRAEHNGCATLAATLAGSDGKFTVLLRKRVARHIESCSRCDDYRRSVFNADTILSDAA